MNKKATNHEALSTLGFENGEDVISWIDSSGEIRSRKASGACTPMDLHLAMPARVGHRYRHQRNYHGLYWCAGTRSHVWYESMSEYSALMNQDHQSSLVAIAAQPALIQFADGTRHYPDYFALHDSGVRVMYDVRPLSLVDETTVGQFQKTAQLCERVGWGYEILHGLEGVQRHNLEWIAGYRHPWVRPSEDISERIHEILIQPRSLDDVSALLNPGEPSKGMPAIFHLLWAREIAYDNTVPLSWGTELRRYQSG
ncbi:TnsA-like heteromeric transposase endonuclease subunit [Arthrobacter sp. AK01]|uniref:TnsA-like heteromeric transposase endonuclease subunit n=1 Tax=Arthrobacter sp. AK01 TaxID=2894084 RepID=UPI001E46571F|nr:TnsA-like heteromeric transposase endonuclease subunit [Arthrobacter sp. AK01]MCD4849699.1 TnsA-like heteromeric transposase endonuclease subunit [Arthrobacter sp. AK01]